MPRILIVDDEPNVRWTLSEFLTREGFDTSVAQDYEGAVKTVDLESIDVAVVDIVLPRKSGIEFLKYVHAREPYLPVIMITADPDVSQVPDIVREGAYDFIPKPVVKAALISAVSRAVEKKKLVEEKRVLEEQLRRHTVQLETLVTVRTAELAEAHNFLNTVLDSSTEYAILAIDNEGRVTLFNRGAELLFGRTAAEMIGGPVDVLFVDAGEIFRERPPLHDDGTTHPPGGHHLEVWVRRHDGSTLLASAVLTPVRQSADGPILGCLGILKDLTADREREDGFQRMKARLEHSERIAALGRAAAQVAHDVKNPLAGLRLYGLVLKKKAAGQLGADAMELIDEIIRAIDHLTDNVDRVLDFARPVTPLLRRVDLSDVVRDAIHMLEPQMAESQIETRVESCASGTVAMLDESLIRSALFNLLLNAIQAMPGGGTLSVCGENAGGEIRLRISDTGIGMTDEQLQLIFEPFYTTKNQGLGLGLPYSQKVIEQHRGTLEVESRKGEGTRILITLPGEP